MKYCYWFNEINHSNLSVAGGKGANLGELTQIGMPVPNGFVISSHAYFKFLEKSSLKNKIKSELEHLDVSDSDKLQKASENVKTSILGASIPKDIAEQILVFYKELSGIHNRKVAVRSSATAEDLPDASFAGQQETFLNISVGEEILIAVKKCVASLFTNRAISYREDKGFNHFKIALSVGVQKMVRSDLAESGVIFTIDTESGFQNAVLINSIYGLGENIVQGKVNPDEFYYFKPTKALLSRKIGPKHLKMIYANNRKNPTKDVPVEKSDREQPSITNAEAI